MNPLRMKTRARQPPKAPLYASAEVRDAKTGSWRAEQYANWVPTYNRASRETRYFRFMHTWLEVSWNDVPKRVYQRLRAALVKDASLGRSDPAPSHVPKLKGKIIEVVQTRYPDGTLHSRVHTREGSIRRLYEGPSSSPAMKKLWAEAKKQGIPIDTPIRARLVGASSPSHRRPRRSP